MKRLRLILIVGLTAISGDRARTRADSAQPDPRQALQSFNDLIGSWRATGQPEGTAEQKRTGFWTESIAWEWQFKKDGPSLAAKFDRGKYFARATLKYS